jgi:cytochrome P450
MMTHVHSQISSSQSRPFRDIPRPRGHALLGHWPEWVGVNQARGILDVLLGYARQRGGLCRVPLGPLNILLLSEPSLIEEALATPEINHKGMAYILTRVVLRNVILENGAVWERNRRLYRDALKGTDVLSSVSRVAPKILATWAARGTASPLPLDKAASALTGAAVTNLLCGRELPAWFEPHRRRIQYELAAVGIDMQCQPWTYASPLRWWRLRQSVRAARALFTGFVSDRRADDATRSADVLDGFRALVEQGRYPDRDAEIADGLVNFLFTAHDVVAASLSFCLYLIAGHPECGERLYDELRTLHTPDEILSRGEFLGQVVKESLRLFPGYPLFSRTTQAERVLGGYRVPRGTMIFVVPYVTHRLATYWPQPDEFRPERFAGRGLSPIPPVARDNYLPFGSGFRGCMASHLALPMLKLLVAETVRQVQLAAVPGHRLQLAYWGTCYSSTGMPVHATARR